MTFKQTPSGADSSAAVTSAVPGGISDGSSLRPSLGTLTGILHIRVGCTQRFHLLISAMARFSCLISSRKRLNTLI